MLSGIVDGYALHIGGGWSGDLLIPDWGDLEDNVVSEVHAKRFRFQKVRVTTTQEKCIFPCADDKHKQEGHVVPRPLRHRQL